MYGVRRLTGFPDSARECHLKRVRSLQGSAWQTDVARFEQLASATLALCNVTLQSALKGTASKRCASGSYHHPQICSASITSWDRHLLSWGLRLFCSEDQRFNSVRLQSELHSHRAHVRRKDGASAAEGWTDGACHTCVHSLLMLLAHTVQHLGRRRASD